ncbi:sulfate transporter [Mycobacterium intermedium]|uniref:Sulfate transporter n=2 Tax=Mycobacterium intermedium TaxID=28445 RepID=A0A1E3SIQ6_MYCIE|nr:STAS domain-containing protein [Mycobacterium intermedium]MCV6963332.1 STAS domain-containing protein [Mycobacterium intermedium]ODR01543.1 sulfate transporter [Mycobacterium intermedium]OPE50292.1 sulfate transporter [Mycobacterium intermedium]ORA97688.1 sulfate transporter [Mycobacterium intermedium]
MSAPEAAAVPNPPNITQRSEESAVILTVGGVLDAGNSGELRDSITKATFDEPFGVVVDVTGLEVPNDEAWSILLSARWQFETRPEVPIVLVCGDRAAREAITHSGVARFMPVFPTEKGALKAVAKLMRRKVQRNEAKLPANLTSLRESRRLVREWLTRWSKPGLIPVALVVVNVFIENVLEHTNSEPVMRVEVEGTTATIAISDTSSAPAVRLASPPKGIDVSGLAIVDALSRAWGCVPTASGKTVWAIIGPENQL